MRKIIVAFTILLAMQSAARAGAVVWVCSTADQPWQTMPTPEFGATPDNEPVEIRLVPTKTYQTIDGFGGCFNELGWAALSKLPADQRHEALRALFGEDGCAFNQARLPIGSSDFAENAYSLDDTPGDVELKDFSIDRDRKLLLPYVKAAMAIRPDLQCWGSPWSPPAWMKTNNYYSKGEMKWQPAILKAHANYLARWAEAYRAEGVHIFAVCPQNEPTVQSVYPSCAWTGPQLRDFLADYLGPAIKQRNTDVQIWLGTINDDNTNDRTAAVLDDPKASAFVSGVALQYGGKKQIADIAQLYPDKKLMQSETECNSGNNSWSDAEKLYRLMKLYIGNGAGRYFAWNMVLDETGMSSWKWRQNALITADVSKQKIHLNGEYYVMRHFSHFLKPGTKLALTTGPWSDKIGFVNPDGTGVLVIGNSSPKPTPARITVRGEYSGQSDWSAASAAIDQHIFHPGPLTRWPESRAVASII